MTEEDDDAIISLEAWRFAKRPPSVCEHPRSVIDQLHGTVECRDCGASLSAFHVLLKCAREENRLYARLRALRAEKAELEAWRPFLKVMRELERMWRGKKALPCCPHCGHGLWPQEMSGAVGVEIEIARRKRAGFPVPKGVEEKTT